VLRGQPVSDPRLSGAVCGLASEILDHRLRTPEIVFSYAIGAISGVVGIVALAIALSASGQHGRHPTVLIVLAVLAFINATIYLLWRPRHLRRKVAQALRLNSGR
jgi:Kef-type K+ transport system membrane component KefB